MSQPWINNIPEVDWHGNNGNIVIGNEPASSRYTEARLSKIIEEGMFQGIKKNNVLSKYMLIFCGQNYFLHLLILIFVGNREIRSFGIFSGQISTFKKYMELRKMVTITVYVRQQKRHRCIEQSFGLCGRGRGWDDLGEWH